MSDRRPQGESWSSSSASRVGSRPGDDRWRDEDDWYGGEPDDADLSWPYGMSTSARATRQGPAAPRPLPGPRAADPGAAGQGLSRPRAVAEGPGEPGGPRHGHR